MYYLLILAAARLYEVPVNGAYFPAVGFRAGISLVYFICFLAFLVLCFVEMCVDDFEHREPFLTSVLLESSAPHCPHTAIA